MFQLIIVVISIALFGLLLMAQINYTPAWTKTVDQQYDVAYKGFTKLASAYDLYANQNSGQGPAVSGDGALPAALRPYIKFFPIPVRNATWSYGLAGASVGTLQQGLHYVCTSGQIDESAARALVRLQQVFSSEQYFINTTGCGLSFNSAMPAEYPSTVYATYFLINTPGIPQ